MKQPVPTVHCIYTDEAEKSLAQLLEESFRLYLVRILATPEKPVVQCLQWPVSYSKEESMYLEISNPMDYHVALYIRLSKEDETEGPSQSVTNQKSLLNEFVQQHRLSVYDTYIDDGWSGTNFAEVR